MGFFWILSALEVTNMWACGATGRRTPWTVYNLISVPQHLILFLDHENFTVCSKYLVCTGTAAIASNTPPTPSFTCLRCLPRGTLTWVDMGYEENRVLAGHSSSNQAPQNRHCLQRDLYPHREDKWAVLMWSMLGKGGPSQKSRTGCTTYLRSSRRYNHYCLLCVREALVPYIVLNEKKIVLTFLCATREICCPLAAATVLCLERPKPSF